MILISLLGAVIARWWLGAGSARRAPFVALLPAAQFALLLAMAPRVLGGGSVDWAFAWAPSLGVELALHLDGFSLLFGLLITGIGTLVVLYAGSYFSKAAASDRARFITLILLFMTAMLGTVLSDDLIALFVFWEWTSLMSFLLIGFERESKGARDAALQSLLVTAGGGLALFGGILLLGLDLGTFSIQEILARPGDVAASPHLPGIIALLLVGAFTKSAQAPFHFWLPRAMAAPTPASAYLHSATMVKLGVYLVARLAGAFEQVSAYGDTLVVFGLLTALLASFNLLRAEALKELLAHSTVASLGLLVLLAGVGGEAGMLALVLFLLAHALYKAALFFIAGGVIQTTGEPRLGWLTGLRRHMPLTALAGLVAGLSMAGFPPLFGFVAKEYMLEAMLADATGWIALATVVLVSAAMVAAAYLAGVKPFRSSSDGALTAGAKRELNGLALPPLVLALAGLLLGVLAGQPAQGLIGSAAGSLVRAPVDASLALWHGLSPALGLSALALALGVALVMAWGGVSRAATAMRVPALLTAERWYQGTVDGILAAAGWSTRLLQNGDQRRYTLTVMLAVIAISAFALFRSGAWLMPVEPGALSLLAIGLLVLVVIGSFAATRSLSLIGALIGLGVVGYSSAVIFLTNGAPDLALTQFAVETFVLVVMMAVLLRLPVQFGSTRTKGERRTDAVVATLFAGVVFVALAGMLSETFDPFLSEYYALTSYAEAFGRNVVNVIIVDFRALDTLGEISVVGFATLSVWVLLRRRWHGRKSKDDA